MYSLGTKPGKAHWLREEPIQIRVFGEPQPFPKKDVAIQKRGNGSVRLVPVDKDYRTRKNPQTGATEKYDRGCKRQWMKQVRDQVARAMMTAGFEPFPKNHPVAMGCLFYLPKAQSNKLPYPSQNPDLDNLEYAVWNALKRQPVNEASNDRWALSGVLFYEDNQIVARLLPSGKIWATDDEPPGVLITVQDGIYITGDIHGYKD